jgi:hypothetical protein
MKPTAARHRTLRAVLLAGVGLIAIGLILVATFRAAHRKVLQIQKDRMVSTVKSSWQRARFLELTSLEQATDALRQAPALRGLAATNASVEPFIEPLVAALGSFLHAYAHGDADSYARFRFPLVPTLANSFWEPSQIEFYSGAASELSLDFGDATYPISNLVVMTSLFRHHQQLTNVAPGAFGTRILRSFAPDAIQVDLGDRPNPGPSVSEWAWQDGGVDLTIPTPTVLYRLDPASEARESAIVARVSLLCETTLATTRACPFYLQLFWHAEAQRFVPTELVIPVNPTELPDLLF